MKVGQEIVSCKYVTSPDADAITQAKVNANQETTGYLAVTCVADNETTDPTPNVQLTSATNTRVYGVVATFNPATQRCGVIRTGVVPIRKNAASAAGDMGTGVLGAANGQVDAGTSGDGTGVVVGRSGNILWVDLDAEQAKIA